MNSTKHSYDDDSIDDDDVDQIKRRKKCQRRRRQRQRLRRTINAIKQKYQPVILDLVKIYEKKKYLKKSTNLIWYTQNTNHTGATQINEKKYMKLLKTVRTMKSQKKIRAKENQINKKDAHKTQISLYSYKLDSRLTGFQHVFYF